MKKEFLLHLGFTLKDNSKGVYFKKYHDNTIIEVDFENQTIYFGGKIKIYDKSFQKMTKPEDWVVFECVNRLLEKGYKSEDILLEKVYPTGRGTSGRLDILVKKEDKAFLMVECKTWGGEFEKEFKNMQKSEKNQLFTYFQQDRNAEFLILYTSNFDGKEIEYKNEIVKIEESYRETSNVEDFYNRWNKLTKDNGVFDNWVLAYNFESKALVYNKLEDIKESDASIIFNRFLEILRHNTVSDKPNAFNKMFTLFLCKIYDELDKQGTNKELEFQWIEGKDDNISFQKKLTDLYKKGMDEFLKKQVTDFSDEDFEKQFGGLISDQKEKQKLLNHITKLRLQKNNEFAIKEVFDDESFEENAKVLKEIVELLQNYKFRYSKKQPFLGDFFELLLTTGLKQEAGQFFTPVPIARFICKSIPIEKIIDEKLNSGENHDILPSVIDYAAGSGHFIIESMEEVQNIINKKNVDNYNSNIKKQFGIWKLDPYLWAKDYTYGIEKDYRLVRTSKVGCYLHGDGIATVIHGDGLDSFEKSSDYRGKLSISDKNDKQENAQFDLVLSNPPYSVSAFKGNLKKENAEKDFALFNSLTDNSSEIEALFIERTKQLLKEGGIASIILPSSILSNTGIYTKAREILLKNFEIISIVSLGSNTFMATGTNTVILFMRKRNKFFANNLEKQISNLFKNLSDVSLNNIENVFSKYVNYVWEGLNFEDYKSIILKSPNDKAINHEIFKEYSKKLKIAKNADLFEEIINIEKEKFLYFVLTYNQNLVLVKSGEKQAEKEFLGYEFSFRKGSEGIHPIQGGKLIDECTKLFDPETLDNPKKVSTYIYKAFFGDFKNEISETLKEHIFRTRLVDLLTFDRVDFEKSISTNIKKKISIGKYPNIKLGEICEVKIGGTPDRSNYEYWENGNNSWVSISEMSGNIINETKENITDLGVKKSNVKLINAGTTLLSFKLSIGKTAIAGKNLYTNEAIAGLCLENEEKVLNKYLFDLFNSKFIDLEKGGFNAFGKSLNSEFLRNEVKIPLPPIDIQQKIVDEIEVLEKEEQEKKQKVEVLKSEIEKIVGGNTNFIELGEIAEIKKGTSITKAKTISGNIPVIAGGKEPAYFHNKANRNGNIITVSASGANSGFVSYFENPIFASDCNTINSKDENVISTKLIFNFLKIQQDKIYLLQRGQAQPHVYGEDLAKVKIPLPPLDIQKQIVSQIEILENEIEILEDDLKQIPEKKKEVLKNYL